MPNVDNSAHNDKILFPHILLVSMSIAWSLINSRYIFVLYILYILDYQFVLTTIVLAHFPARCSNYGLCCLIMIMKHHNCHVHMCKCVQNHLFYLKTSHSHIIEHSRQIYMSWHVLWIAGKQNGLYADNSRMFMVFFERPQYDARLMD